MRSIACVRLTGWRLPDKSNRDRGATLRMLRADGAVIDEDAVVEIVAILTADLAEGYDREPEVYR